MSQKSLNRFKTRGGKRGPPFENFKNFYIVSDLSDMLNFSEVNNDTQRPVSLAWRNIDYTATSKSGESKQILHGVSGIANGGELTVIMGSSGSGKTTLLNTLGQRIRPQSGGWTGDVLVNGSPISNEFRRISVSIMQDDFIH